MITTEFLKAGKAIFTVDNGQGKHYTFRVNAAKGQLFVGLLTGSDNTSDYTCIGRIMPNNTYKTNEAARYLTEYKKPALVFDWALKMIIGQKTLPAGYSIEHAGHCCRCARLLTTIESIANGVGPECIKKMGMVA